MTAIHLWRVGRKSLVYVDGRPRHDSTVGVTRSLDGGFAEVRLDGAVVSPCAVFLNGVMIALVPEESSKVC